MLRSLTEMKGRIVQALDGQVGAVADFFFHNQQWCIHYLVAEMGRGKKVLVARQKLGTPQGSSPVFPVFSKRQTIVDGPKVTKSQGIVLVQTTLRLSSALGARGVQLYCRGDPLGRLEDLIADDHSWRIRYLVGWMDRQDPSVKRFLFAPDWIEKAAWTEHALDLNVSRTAIEASPAYDPATRLTREFESRLFSHFKRRAYWE